MKSAPAVRLSDAQRRALDAERAGPMRVRVIAVCLVSLAIWLSHFLQYEEDIFPVARHSYLYRAAELALCGGLSLWLVRPRALRPMEWVTTATFGLLTVAHGLAILVVHEACVVPFTLTMEWGQMVIVLAAMLSFRPTLVLLAVTWIVGATVTLVRAEFDADLSDHVVLLLIYFVVLAAVRSFDRLRERELIARTDLDRANGELRRQDEARRRLFENLSHDLRTPLAVIHGEAERLEDEASGARRLEGLRRVRTNSAAMTELVEQLLALARLESSRLEVTAKDVEATALLRQVAAQLGGRVRVTGPGPVGVRVDPGHLRRIVTNLAANALRQRQDGEVRIAVRRAAGAVEIDVADDGPGIPADRRARIFERFASFDAGGGLAAGIGLPLARELATLNGGTLELLEGTAATTFRVTLPAAEGTVDLDVEELDVGAPVTESGIRERRSALHESARTVLVVEDHPDMSALLRSLLVERFAVREASTVAEAVAYLGRERPSVVLSDVMLPDGDGYRVLETVRTTPHLAGVPLVFVSALGDAPSRVRGIAAGADDYLAKPFTGSELVARLEAVCARAEERQRALDAQRADLVGELHDGVSASLARGSMLLRAAPGRPDADRIVAGARDAVAEALDEVRGLMALADAAPAPWARAIEGLTDVLRSDAAAFDVALELRTDDDGSVPLLSPVAHHTLRRVAREAVTNALKHAAATRIDVSIASCEGTVRMTVTDDGRGDDGERTGRGLGIARRRLERLGGGLRLSSAPEGGMQLEAWLETEAPESPALSGSEARAAARP